LCAIVAWLLCLVAHVDELVGEVQRMYERFVWRERLTGRKQAVTGQMDVLVVNDDGSAKNWH
jgi:hypothetical protein